MGKNDGLKKRNEGQFGQRAKTRGSTANDEVILIPAPFLLPPPSFVVSYPPLHSGPALQILDLLTTKNSTPLFLMLLALLFLTTEYFVLALLTKYTALIKTRINYPILFKVIFNC